MSEHQQFDDGAIVVSTVTMKDGPDLTIHAGYMGEVFSSDGPWIALLNVQDQWPAAHFRIATKEEAEAYRLLPAAHASLKDTSNPLRPLILYADPTLPGFERTGFNVDIPALGREIENLNIWLEDERRLVLDLQRKLAAAQDENAELRGALAKEVA